MPGKKILIVDDDEEYAKLLALELKAKGYEILSAANGEEGFQKLKSEKPDLVLLDIKMPEMDGFTFVREMKYDWGVKRIPVMILTGYEPMRDLFKMEGIAGYFVKWTDKPALIKSIEETLKISPQA
jgi:CheY-like chemotaxis protein